MSNKMRYKQCSITDGGMAITGNNECQINPKIEEVTVVRTEHPLCGQRLEVVRVSRVKSPNIMIKQPDGSQITMPLSWTDYADSSDSSPAAGDSQVSHLLDVDSLLDVVKIVARIKNSELEASS